MTIHSKYIKYMRSCMQNGNWAWKVMEEAVVYCTRENPLTIGELTSLLSNIDEEKVTRVPPVRPKGSEVYIFTWQHEQEKGNWCADQHRWKNNGKRKYPKKDPIFYKTYYFLDTENGVDKNFCRHVYIPMDASVKHICIHYLGDDSLSVPFPHRSQISQSRNFKRTAPSVLKEVQKSTKEPALVYKNLIAGSQVDNTHVPVLLPRNVSQVRNQQRIERQKKRLTHDDMYNLHELYYQIPQFIWRLELLPDLVCIVGQKDMLDEMKNALQLDTISPKQLLSYDTTFDMGDYYVSVLSFRHVLFESAPVVPVAFLIHERKFESAHTSFFGIVAREIPLLRKVNLPIVLDREINMTKAVRATLPNLQIVYCWNHVRQDAKFWLRNHGATSQDITVYMNDLGDILDCETDEQISEMIKDRKQKWSQSWADYFSEYLENDITHHASKKVLQGCGLYNPYTGITNNQAESVNAMVKRINEWKQMPLDGVTLAFHFLQNYMRAEFLRGRCDLGEFVVRKEYSSAKLEAEEVEFPKNTVSPDNLFDKVRDAVSSQETNTNKTREIVHRPKDDEDNHDRFKSQTVMAKDTVANKKVHHCPESGAFIVEGHSNKYAVTLFPKETCQCPSTVTCTHILAAKLSIGLSVNREKAVVNLTRLRRNSRKKREKKSGKKQPRPNDYEVNPAPDSLCMSNTSLDITFESDLESSTPRKSRKRIRFEASEEELDEPRTPSKPILKRKRKVEDSIAKRVEEEFSTEQLHSVYRKLDEYSLKLPTSINEFAEASSSDDPIFTFYRESLTKFEKYMDDLATILPNKLAQTIKGEKEETSSKKLALLASVLCESVESQTSPLSLLETLKKIPGCLRNDKVHEIKKSSRSKTHLRVFNNDLSPEDISTLEGDKWINDKIVHAYLGLRMNEINESGEGMRITVLPSFLHQLWERSNFESWLFHKISLSSRKILMPINIRNEHWTLLVADTTQKEVSIIDSLQGTDNAQRVINHWIKFMEVRGRNVDEHLKAGWVQKHMESNRQLDGNNCGIFTLMNADAVMTGLPVKVMRQCHVKAYRSHIRNKLLSEGKVNGERVCELPFCHVRGGDNSQMWIQCDACNRWYHYACVGIDSEPESYVCLTCV